MSNDKLEELYYKYYSLVKDTAYKVLGDHGCTDDVCQDVFLKLSDEWLEEDIPDEKREHYLRVSAFRKAIDYYNERKELLEFRLKEKSKPAINIDKSIEDMMEESKFLCKVLRDLKDVNEDWFMIVVKRDIYHEPVALVARDLCISMSLVMTRHSRAKKWINKNYGAEYKQLF